MIASKNLDLEGAPFKGKKKLVDSVLVEFKTDFSKHRCKVGLLGLSPGEDVIVETKRGPFIGRVRSHVERSVISENLEAKVIRKASEADLDVALKNEEMEKQAFHFAIQRIRAHKLEMKLVRAQSAHDGSKIVFYFSADERIDFRGIVKDLAQEFRTRIEMFQIGSRSGAGMIGGIGSCGRELCCSTFLSSFAPISVKVVREQGLSINPEKVSGQCGRLMCCLVYEQHVYRRLRKQLPRKNQIVITEKGEGKVIEVDIIGKKVVVLLDGSRIRYGLDEIVLKDGDRKPHVRKAAPKEGLWEDDLKPIPKKNNKRRRRSRNKKDGNASGTPNQKQNSKKENAPKQNAKKDSTSGHDKNAPKKKSRRRRRKKPSPNSGGEKK